MNFKKNIIENDVIYRINENQSFLFDDKKTIINLKKIQYPAMVLDTEFFNRSHDKNNIIDDDFINEIGHDIVYLLQYSVFKSESDFKNRQDGRRIHFQKLQRDFTNKNYSLKDTYHKFIMNFFALCRKNKIKTLIFAGASNDIKIINSWVEKYKQVLTKQKVDFIDQNHKINYLDIYDILEQNYSFDNKNYLGEELYKENTLPKSSKKPDMITLTSTKRFFEFFENSIKMNLFSEKKTIYELCVEITKGYIGNIEENKNISTSFTISYKNAIKHCYNDVYMTVKFIKVCLLLIRNV